MIRTVLALLATLAATLTRVGRIRLNEGADASKPIAQLGGFLEIREFLQSVDLGSVAASTAENEDIAFTGVAVGDIVLAVNPAETLVANILVGARGPVTVANVMLFRVVNPTAAPIDAAAVNFVVLVARPL